jgi:molybdenum cofactor cytidylyltransferase
MTSAGSPDSGSPDAGAPDAAGSATSSTLAVLLAAGGGSRFQSGDGTHKLLARVGDRPLARHSIEHVVASGLPVIVVTGCEPGVAAIVHDIAEGSPHSDLVTILHNPDWRSGQASSLALAVNHARSRAATAVVVGLADQPDVPAEAWRAVAASAAPLAVATYNGRRGHPVRLAAEMWDELPLSGDSGARDLMRLRPESVGEVPCQGSADDVDTLEDLQRWS